MSRQTEKVSLCFRCEHRARAMEMKFYGRKVVCPRHECGKPEHSSCACYMFLPVQPPILEPSDSERRIKIFQGMRGRPRFMGAAISGRESAAGLPECKIKVVLIGKAGVVQYWVPSKIKAVGKRD